MAIISTLPYTIANGQAVDATPVMADLNQIVSNVNANAVASASLAASGGANLAGFSTSNSTSGTVARALVDRGICVTDAPFNADPTGTNDSTAAIQAAINAAASSGKTIFFPPSSFSGYKVSSSLVIPSGTYYLRLTGAGKSSIITKTASFDLFTWSNPGAGVISLPFTEIDNLAISAGGLTGSSNVINTQYASDVYIHDILLLGLETTGSGIFVVGNGSTYSHEITIDQIYCSTSTGFAVVLFGNTSSDSQLSNLIANCNANNVAGGGCEYGVYVSNNAGNLQIKNIHPYNAKTNNLFLGATPSGTTWQVEDSYIDASAQDCALLDGTVAAVFTNVTFRYPPAGYSGVNLTNATNNKFIGCTFDAGSAGGKAAINENGTSDYNVFTACTKLGTFTNNPDIIMVGEESVFRSQGVDHTITAYYSSLAAGSTVYGGSGYTGSDTYVSTMISPYDGYVKKIYLGSQGAVTSGSITATLLVNGAATTPPLTATLNSANQYFAVGLSGVGIPVQKRNGIQIQIASAAGTPTTSVIATMEMTF